MDAIRKLNRKGFTLVYVALTIVVLVALVSLAVDLGYMYVVKGQLQNAADAAALAGATQLPDTTKVKSEAKKFAQSNVAAGERVVITDDDIEIGNYNPSFNVANPFRPGVTPFNAVQIRARRNVDGETAANQGKVRTFFGGIFGLISGGRSDWSQMGAAASATATHPPRPTAGIVLCDSWCSPSPVAPGTSVTLYWDGVYATNQAGLSPQSVMAFSEYQSTPSVDFSKNSMIMQYLKGTLESPLASNLCGKEIYTNNAATGTALRALEDRFIQEAAMTPSYWEVIVPLVKSSAGGCLSPDVQGTSPTKPDEKYAVTRFAKVKITEIQRNPHPNMTVQFVQCIECSDLDTATGAFTSQLVKNNETLGN